MTALVTDDATDSGTTDGSADRSTFSCRTAGTQGQGESAANGKGKNVVFQLFHQVHRKVLSFGGGTQIWELHKSNP
jgi:hypothetical protein